MGQVKVLVADDRPIVRCGLTRVLTSTRKPRIHVVEAATSRGAREALRRERPDVAVVGTALLGEDGPALDIEQHDGDPDVPWVAVTTFPDPGVVTWAITAGAAALISTHASNLDVVDVVLAVARGQDHLDDTLIGVSDREQGLAGLAMLTSRQRLLVRLVGQGLSNRQIAARLFVADQTVQNYVSRVLSKLHLQRRVELAVLAARLLERRGMQADAPDSERRRDATA